MDNHIENLIQSLVETYSRMLEKFRPCKPGGEFLEQNLITLLVHEFLKANPDGIAFTEIPFLNTDDSGYWSSRLDCYLATDDEAILVEAKGSKSRNDLFQAIEDDLIRMKSQQMKDSFIQMAKAGGGRNCTIPTKVKGLVIADCWGRENATCETASSWKNKSFDGKYKQLAQLSTKARRVGEFDGWDYYILAGQVTEKLWSTRRN